MKKFLKSREKVKFPLLIANVILLAIIASCNNETSTEQTTTTSDTIVTDTASPETENPVVASFNGNFPYLTLSRDDLTMFFSPANVQKLVFRFQFDGGTSLPSLAAFRATSVRAYERNPLSPRLTKTSLLKNLPDELFLGNLELTRTQYTSLMSRAGANTLLIFSPKKEGLNVTYELSWGSDTTAATIEKLVFQADDDLNPSPPDPPSGSN